MSDMNFPNSCRNPNDRLDYVLGCNEGRDMELPSERRIIRGSYWYLAGLKASLWNRGPVLGETHTLAWCLDLSPIPQEDPAPCPPK